MPETQVVLQKYIPAFGLPDLSVFCFKAEVYLKLAGIPYTTAIGDPRKAPKGKLPVLEEGTRLIPDSSAIIDHLERTRGRPLDGWLSAEQLALSTALRSMFEEHLYFVTVYQRWQEDRGWALYKPVFFELAEGLGIPSFVRGLLLPQIRKQTLKQLHGQGMGRHAPDEVAAIGMRLIDAAAQLFRGPYFLGDKPATLDATAFAFLQSILVPPFEGPLKEHLRSKLELRAYCERMHAQLFA